MTIASTSSSARISSIELAVPSNPNRSATSAAVSPRSLATVRSRAPWCFSAGRSTLRANEPAPTRPIRGASIAPPLGRAFAHLACWRPCDLVRFRILEQDTERAFAFRRCRKNGICILCLIYGKAMRGEFIRLDSARGNQFQEGLKVALFSPPNVAGREVATVLLVVSVVPPGPVRATEPELSSFSYSTFQSAAIWTLPTITIRPRSRARRVASSIGSLDLPAAQTSMASRPRPSVTAATSASRAVSPRVNVRAPPLAAREAAVESMSIPTGRHPAAARRRTAADLPARVQSLRRALRAELRSDALHEVRSRQPSCTQHQPGRHRWELRRSGCAARRRIQRDSPSPRRRRPLGRRGASPETFGPTSATTPAEE